MAGSGASAASPKRAWSLTLAAADRPLSAAGSAARHRGRAQGGVEHIDPGAVLVVDGDPVFPVLAVGSGDEAADDGAGALDAAARDPRPAGGAADQVEGDEVEAFVERQVELAQPGGGGGRVAVGDAVVVHHRAVAASRSAGCGARRVMAGGVAGGAGGIDEAVGRLGPVAPGPQRRQRGRLAGGGEEVVHEAVGLEGEDARRASAGTWARSRRKKGSAASRRSREGRRWAGMSSLAGGPWLPYVPRAGRVAGRHHAVGDDGVGLHDARKL
jgi:hypothetical protein